MNPCRLCRRPTSARNRVCDLHFPFGRSSRGRIVLALHGADLKPRHWWSRTPKQSTKREEPLKHMPYPKFLANTLHGLPTAEAVSCLQKSIRRADETNAMLCACELLHWGKGHAAILFSRLIVIAHEDCSNVESPWLLPFVDTAVRHAREWYKADAGRQDKWGRVRMALANTVMMLCRSPHSRVADHMNAACGYANLLEGRKPQIIDAARDMHTAAGRRMKPPRGLQHFRDEGAKLENESAIPDPYRDEAYRLWQLRDQLKRDKLPADEGVDDQGDLFE
jgi:hypothetical protein